MPVYHAYEIYTAGGGEEVTDKTIVISAHEDIEATRRAFNSCFYNGTATIKGNNVKFVIESLQWVGGGSVWERLPNDNEFDNEEDAEAMIESLRELGDDWRDGEFRVVEIAE